MRIDPLNAALVFPRPIGWISTLYHQNGTLANLAPYSFFNAVAYDPATGDVFRFFFSNLTQKNSKTLLQIFLSDKRICC